MTCIWEKFSLNHFLIYHHCYSFLAIKIPNANKYNLRKSQRINGQLEKEETPQIYCKICEMSINIPYDTVQPPLLNLIPRLFVTHKKKKESSNTKAICFPKKSHFSLIWKHFGALGIGHGGKFLYVILIF